MLSGSGLRQSDAQATATQPPIYVTPTPQYITPGAPLLPPFMTETAWAENDVTPPFYANQTATAAASIYDPRCPEVPVTPGALDFQYAQQCGYCFATGTPESDLAFYAPVGGIVQPGPIGTAAPAGEQPWLTPWPTWTPTNTTTPGPTVTPVPLAAYANGTIGIMQTVPGATYRITFSSVVQWALEPYREGDAFYVQTGDSWASYAEAPSAGLRVAINGVFPPTPAYRSDHTYTFFWTAAVGQTEFNFQYIDNTYDDNVGYIGITVTPVVLTATPPPTWTPYPSPTPTGEPSATPTPRTGGFVGGGFLVTPPSCYVPRYADQSPMATMPLTLTYTARECYQIVPYIHHDFGEIGGIDLPVVHVDDVELCVSWFEFPAISLLGGNANGGIDFRLDWLLLMPLVWLVTRLLQF